MTSDATDNVPWLTSQQQEAWASLMVLIGTLPSALDEQLQRDSGLNLYEYHVLTRLAQAPDGQLPMTDLAQAARGSASRLSHAVKRLERNGLVGRVACTTAGRRTAATLTAAGRTKLAEAAPGHVREARRLVVDMLAPHQLTALGEASRSIATAIEPGLSDILPGNSSQKDS